MQPTFGEVITSRRTGNTYTIGEMIGEGGFGVVYSCTDSWANKLAVKVLKAQDMSYDETKCKAEAEFEKLVALRHPCITYVYDAFECRDTFYIVTELCLGPVHDLLTFHDHNSDRWLMPIARNLLQAVHFIHLNKMVHQDIHSGNVFTAVVVDEMTDTGNVYQFKLADLGIAKLLQDVNAKNTRADWMLPPEVMYPGKFGRIDHRADLYHVGLLLLQFACRKPLTFTAEEVLEDKPRGMAESLPHPLNIALSRALRMHSEERTPSAMEFWHDLNSSLPGTPIGHLHWLDSTKAAHGTGDHVIMNKFSFCFENPQLPLALQAVGGALVDAGWTIDYADDQLFRSWGPAFRAKRREESFYFFIRTKIAGFCLAEPFAADLERFEAQAAEPSIRCVWVTVTLTPSVRSFTVLAEGLEEFADELRVPFELSRPEEFRVVKIGVPADPEPVLDEAHAAAVFVDCMGKRDLREISKILVEDFRYTSETLDLEILGRHQFLSYLGGKLNEWATSGKVFEHKCGTVSLDGRIRPCMVTFDDQGEIIGCTVFTGRKGHIEWIQNVSVHQRSAAQGFISIPPPPQPSPP